MILMNYLQGGNGDANIENGLGNTEGEGESRGNGESSINIYTLSTVGWTAGEKLPCSRGSPGWCSVMTWRGGMGAKEGSGVSARMYNYNGLALLYEENQHNISKEKKFFFILKIISEKTKQARLNFVRSCLCRLFIYLVPS